MIFDACRFKPKPTQFGIIMLLTIRIWPYAVEVVLAARVTQYIERVGLHIIGRRTARYVSTGLTFSLVILFCYF